MMTFHSIAKKHVDNAIDRISKGETKNMEDGDESVLEKLLKVNPDYAFIMAMDMLLAGIDTVGGNLLQNSKISKIFCSLIDIDSRG